MRPGREPAQRLAQRQMVVSSTRVSSDRYEVSTRAVPRAPGRPRVLAFWEGGHAWCELPDVGEVAIGRAVGSGLWIDHDSVSRKHAIVRPGSPVTIEDLGSSNG